MEQASRKLEENVRLVDHARISYILKHAEQSLAHAFN